jgi:hypothetical protein
MVSIPPKRTIRGRESVRSIRTRSTNSAASKDMALGLRFDCYGTRGLNFSYVLHPFLFPRPRGPLQCAERAEPSVDDAREAQEQGGAAVGACAVGQPEDSCERGRKRGVPSEVTAGTGGRPGAGGAGVGCAELEDAEAYSEAVGGGLRSWDSGGRDVSGSCLVDREAVILHDGAHFAV